LPHHLEHLANFPHSVFVPIGHP